MTRLNEIALFTDIDKENFDQGLQWVRAAKSFGIPPTVIDHGMTDEQADKLEELRVRLVDPVARTGYRSVDAWQAVVEYGKGPCCYWDVSLKLTPEALERWSGPLGACIGPISSYQLLSPIASIESRMRLAKAIDERVVSRFGGYFLPWAVVGDQPAWGQLTGMSALLIETGVTDSLLGLRALNLNLYAAYTADMVVLPLKP